MSKFFTSESVTEGHPDKIADQISDAILDDILSQDPHAHVACETSVTTGMVLVMGEIRTKGWSDIQKIVRDTVKKIGYDKEELGFNANSLNVLNVIHSQSADIAMGVDDALEERGKKKKDSFNEIGAGDQGIMFGYACDETKELMPMPISLAHKLAKRLTTVRKNKTLKYLRPDGKTQVTIEYDQGKPKRVDTILISTQHDAKVSLNRIRTDLLKHVINPVVPKKLIDKKTRILVNPTGRFVIGGPNGDSGLTGRKIIVDTYGGYARHGGGAFSGKDASKVDRSAAYIARYAAKNVVASGIAKSCEIELAYAIGVAKPVSILVDTKGTGKVSDEKIAKIIEQLIDFRPAAIIKKLKLTKPIFSATASNGHFGKSEFPWEQTDLKNKIKKMCE